MRRIGCLAIALLCILTIGCNKKGDLLDKSKVNLLVIEKQNNNTLLLRDVETDNEFKLKVTHNIYGAVDNESVVEATKTIYDKDSVRKAYYKIETKRYNEATKKEIKNAKKLTTSQVTVKVTAKYESTNVEAPSTYYILYKYKDDNYATSIIVPATTYYKVDIGQEFTANRNEYILQDNRKVIKYELILGD